MMKTIYLAMAFVLSVLVLPGCDKDGALTNPGGNIEVKSTFQSMYPDAGRVEWERKGNYWVAEFWKNGREVEAWFDLDGNWYMTETDLRFDDLPEAVKTSFRSGEYKDWRVDDVDMIERKDVETFYVLDVEKGEVDYDLHYAPDGTLIKAVADR